jgi:hypothetical protein
MQTLKSPHPISMVETQSTPQNPKDTKLIAIWEIDSHDLNNRRLMCRWIRI